MNEALHTRSHWMTAAKMLLAVLVLLAIALASMLQPAALTKDSSPAVHPGVHAMGTGEPGSAEGAHAERRAEVVAGYQRGNPR